MDKLKTLPQFLPYIMLLLAGIMGLFANLGEGKMNVWYAFLAVQWTLVAIFFLIDICQRDAKKSTEIDREYR